MSESLRASIALFAVTLLAFAGEAQEKPAPPVDLETRAIRFVDHLAAGEWAAASEHFDAVITVDAHLHRIHHLHEAVPVSHAVNLSAAELIGEYVKAHVENPLLLGPDEESKQWVQSAAKIGDFEFGVALKKRMGDRSVNISLPDISFANRSQ